VDTHRTPWAQAGISRPSGESGQYGRERRTYTLTRAILAGSAALGHGAWVKGYPVPALQDAHACANADMSTVNTRADFEKLFLPHLDAAYNLARLLTRNAHDAEDVVQESYLKAWRAFSSFRGEASRPWLLTIVRNTSFTWLRDNRPRADHTEYDDGLHVSGGPRLRLNRLGMNARRPWNGASRSFHPIFGKPSYCAKWKNCPISRSRKSRAYPAEQ